MKMMRNISFRKSLVGDNAVSPLPPAREALVLFQIDEIRQGKLLHVGKYTSIFEVISITQKRKVENVRHQWARDLIDIDGKRIRKKAISNGSGGPSSPPSSPSEKRLCVKYIRREFMDSHNDFEMAASNLANEAQMMTALNHKNISKLRGTSLDGTEAYYKTGRHDGYFLLLDKICETLDQRITRWRNRGNWLRIQSRAGYQREKIQNEFLFERIKAAYELADAIDYMHGHGMAHTTLSEDSVGFNARGELQVYNLGDAIPVSTSPCNETSEETIILPLEKESNDALLLKEDVAAFTMILCELLVLRPKVHGLPLGISFIAENNSTIRAFRKLAKLVPRRLLDLLQRGLECRPALRPTMSEFVKELGSIMISLDKENTTLRANNRVTHFQLPMPLLSLKSAACRTNCNRCQCGSTCVCFKRNTTTPRAA